MPIVLDHQIARIPEAIGVFGSAVGVDRHTTVPRHGGMDDTVREVDLAIGDGQRLEELGVLAVQLANRHIEVLETDTFLLFGFRGGFYVGK